MNDRDRIDNRIIHRLHPADQGAMRSTGAGGPVSGQSNAYFEDGGAYPAVRQWFMFDVAGAGFTGTSPGPYYVPLAVDHTKVTAGLESGFPCYLPGTNLPAAFWSGVLATGGDMVLTETDGTTLVPFDLVQFNRAANTLELHCKPAAVSSAADTHLRLYYGNPMLEGQTAEQKRAVWSSGYVAVFHLAETATGTGTAGVYRDAHGYNHGADYVDPGGKVGKLYSTGGETFDGTNDYVSAPSAAALDITGALTMQCWLKTTDTSAGLMSKSADTNKYFDTAANKVYELGILAGTLYFNISDGTTATGTSIAAAAFIDDAWHLVHATWNGTNAANGLHIYRDGGSVKAGTSTITAVQTKASTFSFGGGASWWLAGIMDEVRVSNVERSAAWIATEYANQNAPSTFWIVSPVVTVADWATGGRLG